MASHVITAPFNSLPTVKMLSMSLNTHPSMFLCRTEQLLTSKLPSTTHMPQIPTPVVPCHHILVSLSSLCKYKARVFAIIAIGFTTSTVCLALQLCNEINFYNTIYVREIKNNKKRCYTLAIFGRPTSSPQQCHPTGLSDDAFPPYITSPKTRVL